MTKLVTIILVALAMVLVVACKPSNGSTTKAPATSNTVLTGSIVYLEYSEYGTMAQPNDYFKIELLDNGKVKVNRQRGIDEEEFVADRSLIVELKKIYEAGRVNSWKDSYEPKYEVLDGYSWNLDVRFDNGLEKYSHGNNARPDSDALRQFSTLIWNLKYIIKDGLVTIVISP